MPWFWRSEKAKRRAEERKKQKQQREEARELQELRIDLLNITNLTTTKEKIPHRIKDTLSRLFQRSSFKSENILEELKGSGLSDEQVTNALVIFFQLDNKARTLHPKLHGINAVKIGMDKAVILELLATKPTLDWYGLEEDLQSYKLSKSRREDVKNNLLAIHKITDVFYNCPLHLTESQEETIERERAEREIARKYEEEEKRGRSDPGMLSRR